MRDFFMLLINQQNVAGAAGMQSLALPMIEPVSSSRSSTPASFLYPWYGLLSMLNALPVIRPCLCVRAAQSQSLRGIVHAENALMGRDSQRTILSLLLPW